VPLTRGGRTVRNTIEKISPEGTSLGGRREIFADIERAFNRAAGTQDTRHIVPDTADTSGNIIALNLQRIAEL
jgi:hypothetical protein